MQYVLLQIKTQASKIFKLRYNSKITLEKLQTSTVS
jgi:hypothetical protein